MKGIGNLPYVDCQQAMAEEMERLRDLNLEICHGIATGSILAGVYGPGIMESERFGNFLAMKKNLTPELSDLQGMWNKMTHNQQNIFAKLYLKLYNPSTVVYLRQQRPGMDPILAYLRKGDENLFDWTANMDGFPNLRRWLEDVKGPIFESYGRIIFFIHEHDCKLLIHRDGMSYVPHNNEFLWLNPTRSKKFFIYDEDTGDRHHVDTGAAFFNDLDMHGGEVGESMSWSLRIDGKFSKEFKRKIGIDHLDRY
jgi:hypothetical protein